MSARASEHELREIDDCLRRPALSHLNRIVFQSKSLRGHHCTIPAWSLLPRIEHFFTEVSRLRIERAPERVNDFETAAERIECRGVVQVCGRLAGFRVG